MLSSAALRAGGLLAAALLAGVVLLAVMAAGGLWLWRRIRRRSQVLGLALAGRAHGAAAGRARRRLWRAVSTAGHAVARQAGAPAGDLDALCRRLRHVAAHADRSLSVPGRAPAAGGELGPVSSQVGDLVTAAGLIQDAAASAVASMSRPAARSPADDARREAVALSAGIASASRAAAGGLPGEPT